AVLLILFTFETSKFLKQAFLLRCQAGWCHNLNNDMLIATSTAMDYRHTHAFETEGTITLSASRYLEHCGFAIYRRDLNLITQGSLRKADRQFIDDIIALPFEELMGFYSENNIQ